MLANYQTDAEGRLQSLTTYPFDGTMPALEIPDNWDMAALRDYIVQGAKLVFDALPAPLPTAEEQIADLKAKLADTDYIAAKAVDRIIGADGLSGILAALKSINDEYASVFEQRAAWRKEINDLEEKGDDA